MVSPDLLNWQRWNIPENTSDYTTTDLLKEVNFTATDPRYFFRFEVTEP